MIPWADPQYPSRTAGGKLTFKGVWERCFPLLCDRGKDYDLIKIWSRQTAFHYASDYLYRIVPNLPAHVAMEDYDEKIFQDALNKLQAQYHYTRSTMEHYRYLMWIIYRAGAKDGLYEDRIWWDASDDTGPIDQNESIRQTRIPKSFTHEQEVAFLLWFRQLDPATARGEEVGLVVMYFNSLRNNDACGLNYEHLYRSEQDPDLALLDVIQSTTQGSNQLQASGKTGNSPRTLLVLPMFEDFILKRRAAIEEQVANGTYELPPECGGSVGKLPIVCRGLKYGIRCKSDDLTKAARELFKTIGISNSMLANLERMLRSKEAVEEGLQERDPTAYLFRRNNATILRNLGFNSGELQYHIGHKLEDPNEARNYYTNLDRLRAMKEKLNWHPANAVLGYDMPIERVEVGKSDIWKPDGSSYSVELPSSATGGTYIIDTGSQEPGDHIQVCLEGKVSGVSYDVSDVGQDYQPTVNIRRTMWQVYSKLGRKAIQPDTSACETDQDALCDSPDTEGREE